MQISAFSQGGDHNSQWLSEAGFSLIELMLVLAILGMLSAFAFPRFIAWIDSAQLRAQQDKTAIHLASLPSRAFREGRRIEPCLEPLPSSFPVNAELECVHPWDYQPNGVTNGGTLWLIVDGVRQSQWAVYPPDGRVERLQ